MQENKINKGTEILREKCMHSMGSLLSRMVGVQNSNGVCHGGTKEVKLQNSGEVRFVKASNATLMSLRCFHFS